MFSFQKVNSFIDSLCFVESIIWSFDDYLGLLIWPVGNWLISFVENRQSKLHIILFKTSIRIHIHHKPHSPKLLMGLQFLHQVLQFQFEVSLGISGFVEFGDGLEDILVFDFAD
jgi:hypothetical protein